MSCMPCMAQGNAGTARVSSPLKHAKSFKSVSGVDECINHSVPLSGESPSYMCYSHYRETQQHLSIVPAGYSQLL